MRRDAGSPRSVRGVWMEELMLRVRWKRAYSQYQRSCSKYLYLPCFCTPNITRTTVLPPSHSVFERVVTTRALAQCNSRPKTAFTANTPSATAILSIIFWAVISGDCLTGPHILLARVSWRVCLYFLLTHLSRLLGNMFFSARLHMWFQRNGAPPHYSRRVRQWLCKINLAGLVADVTL
jgi:hypothetical protein